MTKKLHYSRIVWNGLLLIIIIAVLFCSAGAAALVADVKPSVLPTSLEEGSNVAFTIVISGIPAQAEMLQISTDLIPVVGTPLWTIQTTDLNIDGSVNDQLIRLTPSSVFPVSITIDVSGQVPTITTTTAVEGIAVVKRPTQRSAYHYYHVEALDDKNQLIGGDSTETGVLTITVADEDAFLYEANEIDNPAFRGIITSMYNKGLTAEAWELLTWYKSQPGSMPIFLPIIIGVVALILGLVVGFILGSRRRNDESAE